MQHLHWLSRTQLLIGEDAISKLQQTNILLVGLGGVGSFAAEFLVRAGIGHLTIVDGDSIDITNINRQLPALHSTISKPKTTIMQQRLLDINPQLQLTTISKFITPEYVHTLITQQKYTYVLDCIDSITPKLQLLRTAYQNGNIVISSMGAGSKLDTNLVQCTDISKTYMCPLAQQIRKFLRQQHQIKTGIMAVFSPEKKMPHALQHTDGKNYKKSYYGTISYMPALFGLKMAAWVIQHCIQTENKLA